MAVALFGLLGALEVTTRPAAAETMPVRVQQRLSTAKDPRREQTAQADRARSSLDGASAR
jgi:hypothetical protein